MHGMLVLDENGFDRLAIGDSVPDPNIGRRIAPSTGIIINDEQGNERTGYGSQKVGEHRRVILGLDSDKGSEGLVLELYDQGGVGLSVRDAERTAFLGTAAPGHWLGLPEGFHGLVFKEGDKIIRQIEAR
jgi:hypothetical protein